MLSLKKLFPFILILTLFSPVIFCQGFGTWKDYTNMETVEKIIIDNTSIWAATNGGFYNYDFTTNKFTKFTKSEGISSHNITAIALYKKKLWLGTKEGFIDIYDPSNGSFKVISDIFRSDNTLKSINDIEIKNDTVFVATDFGLSLIDANTFNFIETVVKFGNFPTEIRVNAVRAGSQIFVATDRGVAKSNINSLNLSSPSSWENFPIDPSLLSNPSSSVKSLNKIVFYKNDTLISSDKGILKLQSGTLKQFLYKGFNVTDMEVHNGNLYSAVTNTIHKRDGTQDVVIFTEEKEVLNDIEFLNNDIYLASLNGIVKISGKDTTYILPNGPSSNSFLNIKVDKSGNLWSATGKDGNGVGAFKFDGQKWTIYNKDNSQGIISNQFHRVDVANDNTVFLSNWGMGFTMFKDGKFKTYTTDSTGMVGIPGHPNFLVVYDVQKDSKGNIWVLNFWAGNKKVLSELTPQGKWFHYELGPPLFPQVVVARNLVIDQFDTKWFVVTDGGERGVYYFNENKTPEDLSDDVWGKVTVRDGLKSDIVNDLIVDKRGEIVIGTKLGINIIPDPQNPSNIRGDLYFAIREQVITAIATDALNRKWVGTTQGIFLMSSDGSNLIETFNIDNSPLPDNNILSVAVDSKTGTAYFGTDFGLSSLSTFAVQPAENYSDVFVYPNPLILNGSGNTTVTIDGLMRNSQIKILNINGKLINEFATLGGRVATWNGRDENGRLVPTGVYIIIAYDEEAQNVGKTKIAVIHK